jgi:hypothetical protein
MPLIVSQGFEEVDWLSLEVRQIVQGVFSMEKLEPKGSCDIEKDAQSQKDKQRVCMFGEIFKN